VVWRDGFAHVSTTTLRSVFALQIVTSRSLIPVPDIVTIELHFQIANREGGMETAMISPITGFNCDNDPVDTLFESPKSDIELKALVFSWFGVPVK
jgi:hypothetical protein